MIYFDKVSKVSKRILGASKDLASCFANKVKQKSRKAEIVPQHYFRRLSISFDRREKVSYNLNSICKMYSVGTAGGLIFCLI